MSRQYFIPGQGGLNETGRRQYFIPGMLGANESGTASVSASFTETLATGDGHSAAMTASAPFADAATAADSYIPLPRYFASFTPGGYAINEGVARQFFVPGRGGVNLTGRAKIVPPVTVAASYATSDSAATSDSLSSAAAFSAPKADFVFASDLPPVQPTYSSRYGRAQYGRARFGAGKLPPTPPPSGGSSAAYGRAAYGRTHYASKGGISFNPTFTAPYVMVRFGESLAEPIAVADLLGAVATFGDMVTERASAADGATSFFPDQEGLYETAITADDVAAVGQFILQLSEAIMATDRMDGYIDIPTPLQRIIIADDD